jgi:FKBP-type peptidyl-prolyl cis-trans isomerase
LKLFEYFDKKALQKCSASLNSKTISIRWHRPSITTTTESPNKVIKATEIEKNKKEEEEEDEEKGDKGEKIEKEKEENEDEDSFFNETNNSDGSNDSIANLVRDHLKSSSGDGPDKTTEVEDDVFNSLFDKTATSSTSSSLNDTK